MKTLANLQEEGYQKIKDDLKLLMGSFKSMLVSLGEKDLAELLPWINDTVPLHLSKKVKDEKLVLISNFCTFKCDNFTSCCCSSKPSQKLLLSDCEVIFFS